MRKKNINKAVRILSEYGGYQGMIAGQAEDTLEAGKWNKKDKTLMEKSLNSYNCKDFSINSCKP